MERNEKNLNRLNRRDSRREIMQNWLENVKRIYLRNVFRTMTENGKRRRIKLLRKLQHVKKRIITETKTLLSEKSRSEEISLLRRNENSEQISNRQN